MGIENGLYVFWDTTSRCVLVSMHVVMDETKFPATVKATQFSSTADNEFERNQVPDLYGQVNQNKIDNADAARYASEVRSHQPLQMTESLDIRRDMTVPDDGHVPSRIYREKGRIARKLVAFAA